MAKNSYVKILKVQDEKGQRIRLHVTQVYDQITLISNPIEFLKKSKESFVKDSKICLTTTQKKYQKTLDQIEAYLQLAMDKELQNLLEKDSKDGNTSTSDKSKNDSRGVKESDSGKQASRIGREGAD